MLQDYTKMSTHELEQLSNQFQQKEYQIMKELLRRNQGEAMVANTDDVQPADMQLTEDDFS